MRQLDFVERCDKAVLTEVLEEPNVICEAMIEQNLQRRHRTAQHILSLMLDHQAPQIIMAQWAASHLKCEAMANSIQAMALHPSPTNLVS